MKNEQAPEKPAELSAKEKKHEPAQLTLSLWE
jgi:hypothetical protein